MGIRAQLRRTLPLCGACCLLALVAAPAAAQDGSLLRRNPEEANKPITLQESSFIYRELPPEARPSELKQHDIITVIVDYRTRMLSEGDAEARKTVYAHIDLNTNLLQLGLQLSLTRLLMLRWGPAVTLVAAAATDAGIS